MTDYDATPGEVVLDVPGAVLSTPFVLAVTGASSTPQMGTIRRIGPVPGSTLTVRGPGHRARMGRPSRIYSDATSDPVYDYDAAITLDIVQPPIDGPGDFTTVIPDVRGHTEISVVDKWSDVATGNVALLRKISDGAGNLDPNPGVVQWNPDRYLLVRLFGKAVASLGRASVTEDQIAQGEESQEVMRVSSAQGHAAKLADTIIAPVGQLRQFPLQEQVRMDWTSPWVFTHHNAPLAFDWSGYDLPYVSFAEGPYGGTNQFGRMPEKFPDWGARWIWDRSGTVPDGDCYFYKTPGLPYAGQFQLWTAGFGPYEVWVNGVKVAEDTKAYTGQAQSTDLYLDASNFSHFSAGGNLFAVRSTAVGGRGGFMAALYGLFPNGSLGDLIFHTDGSWRVIGYPAEPPGMTAGNLLLSLLAQSVDTGGQFQHWTTTFNGQVDTAGRPWPILRDQAFDIGTNMLDVLRKLADGDIEWSVDPVRYRLNAWVAGSDGALTAAQLQSGYVDDATGNLRQLSLAVES